LLRAEVDGQQRMAIGGDAERLRGARGLVQVAAGHDDEPAAPRQRLCGVQADAGGSAGDDHGRIGRGCG